MVIDDRDEANPLAEEVEEKYKIIKVSVWAFCPTLALLVFSITNKLCSLFAPTFNNTSNYIWQAQFSCIP